ncbi:MAG TPA: Sir2 family NAD-dependent protein deacetylase [Nitrospiria bacterium]|nr:Sir2 family NAD-dependent protein deacetylase [Nitrospiria bacterium]
MTESLLDAVVERIRSARRVLFLTGAGMSAESGIPTFRDRDGYWRNFPIFKEKGLAPQDLASPWAFRTVLHHAWAFYEWRRRNAYENKPHGGYAVLCEWMSDLLPESFIHTTNTDGYHLRAGTPRDRLREVHGSMWRLQCLDGCTDRFWEEPRVPLCDLDLYTLCASNFPVCRYCGGVARPHILMFNDGEYVGHPEQDTRYRTFRRNGVDLVFLIGCSGGVPTNDYEALSCQERGAVLVNVNPDPSANPSVRADISLVGGAASVLSALNRRLAGKK